MRFITDRTVLVFVLIIMIIFKRLGVLIDNDNLMFLKKVTQCFTESFHFAFVIDAELLGTL